MKNILKSVYERRKIYTYIMCMQSCFCSVRASGGSSLWGLKVDEENLLRVNNCHGKGRQNGGNISLTFTRRNVLLWEHRTYTRRETKSYIIRRIYVYHNYNL